MVLEELGRGGMGIVYRCTDRKMLKDVAVKVIAWSMSDDDVIRFHKEAKTLARLQHPNILGVQHFGHSEDDSLFLVMDLLTGRSLAELLEADKLPPFEDALDIFMQICDGLGHAHGKGILHRDIKPSNVFVARYAAGDLQVVITDFGLAKLLNEDQRLTKTGISVGTPPYMSPEQSDGKAVDERSDIYSLGCMMFEMLTGRRPFLGETIPQLLLQHVQQQPPTLTEVAPDRSYPDEMERIIAKCLEKKPENRYAKAKDLKADLQKLRDSLINVHFAQHSEVSGAYAPAQTFLRTGAFLIKGFQNLTRPKQEKKFYAVVSLAVLSIAAAGGYGGWQLYQEHKESGKMQEQLEDLTKHRFGSHDTSITLTHEVSRREPKRLREARVWVTVDKDARQSLADIANNQTTKFAFVEGGSHPDWINLAESDVKDEDLESIATVEIRGLRLNDTKVTDKSIEIASRIKTLEELYLNRTLVTDNGLKSLIDRGGVTMLTLVGTGITDRGVAEISKFRKLSYLQLDECKNVTGQTIDMLRNCNDLFHLGLKGSGFKLSNIPKLRHVRLTALDLSDLDVTDADLKTLADTKIPGLETLYLNDNPAITRQGLITIGNLKDLSGLHLVGCTGITRADTEAFHKFRDSWPCAVYLTE